MSQHLRLQISWERYRLPFPVHIDMKRTLKSSWLLLDQTPPHCSAPHLLLWSLPTAPLGRSSPPATWRLFQFMEMWTCVRRMFSWVRRYRSSETFCFPSFHRVSLVRFPNPLATDIQMIHVSMGTQLGFTNTSYSWSAGRPSNSSLPLITTCNRSLSFPAFSQHAYIFAVGH